MNYDITKAIPICSWKKSEFAISTDNERINLATVYQFLKSTLGSVLCINNALENEHYLWYALSPVPDSPESFQAQILREAGFC